MRPDADGTPRRVLVVSADMGGGHHATGRALAERVEDQWPGSEIRWVDTLDAMGSWVGPLFRRIYVANVRTTPWLYEFFYASLWRHRWFADASKGFVAAWSGRRLAPPIERFDPDLIVSTYPLGSAGLAWLRRHRSLAAPVGAWVSDFAPHPFWLYRDLDATYLMHDSALPMARLAEPGIAAAVTGPTVEGKFHPGDGTAERARLGLDPDGFLVLVSCGAYGFGAMAEAVGALLAAGDRVRVVAVCGRNEPLRRRIAALGGGDRLVTLGWTDEMPALTRAADLVVTNAGGATALEALATGRPVVMYKPIAAHGAANAALMTYSGLAETCTRPVALTALVAAAAADGGERRRAVQDYLDSSERTELADLAYREARPAPRPAPGPAGRIAPVPRAWPLRPPDSFFLHVQTPDIAQQVGAMLTAVPEPGERPLTAEALRERIGEALPVLPTLRRRLVPRGDWRRPGWVVDSTVGLEEHVTEVTVDSDDKQAAMLDDFWSRPVPLRRPPWELLVVRRDGEDTTTLAFKVHHAIADGLSLIGTLDRLLESPVPDPPPPARSAAPATSRWRSVAATARRVARGMWELGFHAAAPHSTLNRPLSPNRRGVLTIPLPTDEIRSVTGRLHVRSSELLLGVVAEGLHRAGVAGGPGQPATLRTMLPVAMNAGGGAAGNSTGAVSVNLPVGPMDVADRIHAIRGDLHRRIDLGEPHAAAFVMRALGMFPAPVHGWMSRRVYSSQFFNVIASYVPGPVHERRLVGNRLTAVYPVVALAEGVPLGIGILRYAHTTGVCVLYDESLRRAVEPLADAVRAAFADVLAG